MRKIPLGLFDWLTVAIGSKRNGRAIAHMVSGAGHDVALAELYKL